MLSYFVLAARVAIPSMSTAASQGKEIKKELNAATIAFDLPKGHDLRNQLVGYKAKLESQLELFLF